MAKHLIIWMDIQDSQKKKAQIAPSHKAWFAHVHLGLTGLVTLIGVRKKAGQVELYAIPRKAPLVVTGAPIRTFGSFDEMMRLVETERYNDELWFPLLKEAVWPESSTSESPTKDAPSSTTATA